MVQFKLFLNQFWIHYELISNELVQTYLNQVSIKSVQGESVQKGHSLCNSGSMLNWHKNWLWINSKNGCIIVLYFLHSCTGLYTFYTNWLPTVTKVEMYILIVLGMNHLPVYQKCLYIKQHSWNFQTYWGIRTMGTTNYTRILNHAYITSSYISVLICYC